MEQHCLSVSAASEGPHSSTKAVTRMQRGVQIKESSWTEVVLKGGSCPKERTERKCSKMQDLPNWVGMEHREKYMRRNRGTLDTFFGKEHGLRKEQMEEQFKKKKTKEGWRFAADAARMTDENANSEDHTHTSRAVFVAVDSNLGAVVGTEAGAVTSIPGNEGSIAQAWVNVGGGVGVFLVYVWHSEGRPCLRLR